MGTMAEILKAKGKGKGKGKNAPVERSDEELLALMDQLFGGAEDEEEEEDEGMDKGAGYSYGSKRKGNDPRAELLRRAAMMDEDEDEELEDEDMDKGRPLSKAEEAEEAEDEDMEKARSERREMMDRAYSLIDDLSEDQLRAFLADHEISKAIAMMVIGGMSNSDLKELVSFEAANGSPVGGPVSNPHGA
jgi:hypothetical protein